VVSSVSGWQRARIANRAAQKGPIVDCSVETELLILDSWNRCNGVRDICSWVTGQPHLIPYLRIRCTCPRFTSHYSRAYLQQSKQIFDNVYFCNYHTRFPAHYVRGIRNHSQKPHMAAHDSLNVLGAVTI
jgi:hypothetical protein